MREHAVNAFAVGDADHLQGLDGLSLDILRTLALAIMESDNLIDLVADPEDRIEGGHGFLEDHGDHIAADVLHGFTRRF